MQPPPVPMRPQVPSLGALWDLSRCDFVADGYPVGKSSPE